MFLPPGSMQLPLASRGDEVREATVVVAEVWWCCLLFAAIPALMQRFFVFGFNWGIVALQYYVGFLCTRSEPAICTHMSPPSHPKWKNGWRVSVLPLHVTMAWCTCYILYQKVNLPLGRVKRTALPYLWRTASCCRWRVPLALPGSFLPVILCDLSSNKGFLVTPLVKNLPALGETWVWSLRREDPLEKGMATSILA